MVFGPVVGDRLDDRIARPAVGAVDEGIAIPKILRTEQLRQAIAAGGDVRRHLRQGRALGIAFFDDEPRLALDRLDIHPPARLNLGQRRLIRPLLQPLEEFLDPLCGPLELDSSRLSYH